MSCKHGNWAPCDECDEEDAAWQSAYNAGVKQTEAETALLREQLKVAVGALENISKNETMPSRVIVCPRIDGRAYEAKQALAQIKDLEK